MAVWEMWVFWSLYTVLYIVEKTCNYSGKPCDSNEENKSQTNCLTHTRKMSTMLTLPDPGKLLGTQ